MRKELYDYLLKAEGTEIHRIKTETDITTMCGIFKSAHPDARIFETIDGIAANIGFSTPSSMWTDDMLDLLNREWKITITEEFQFELISEFYDKYMSRAYLEVFPKEAVVSMFSMFTLSEKYSSMSAQAAFNILVTNDYLNHDLLAVDGALGQKSSSAIFEIKKLSEQNRAVGLYFETALLLNMAKYFARLAVNNPDKYLHVLNGWNNRLETLSKID